MSNIKFPTLLNGPRGSAARAQMPTAAPGLFVSRGFFPMKLAILAHLRPSEAILVSTYCQEVPILTPRSPERAQLVAKITQNTPQEPPTRSPKTPKCSKNVVLSFDFRLSPFSQISSPRPPNMLKIAPQIPSRWPSWLQLGGSWRHLGSNLPPSWPFWARFWSIRARPKFTKISQDSF